MKSDGRFLSFEERPDRRSEKIALYLFGGVTLAQFQAQAMGSEIPSQLLSMLPYIATIVVLALISRDATAIRLNAPASLGKPFHPDA